MHLSFAALLRQPTARRYLQLRKQLLADNSGFEGIGFEGIGFEGAGFEGAGAGVDSQLMEIEQVLSSLESRQRSEIDRNACQGIREEIESLLGPGLLSLKLHRLGGIVAILLGDDARAALHRFTFDSIQQAIRATGIGTRARPYAITYRCDAYELVARTGGNIVSQCIVEAGARRFDVLLTSEESELWFDVTDLLPATAVAKARRTRPTMQTSVRGKLGKAISRSRH